MPNLDNNNNSTLDFHTILHELQQAKLEGDVASYQTLFTELSDAIFTLFTNGVKMQCRDMTNQSYYVNIEEVDDVLYESLINIHMNIQTYKSTCSKQAYAWVAEIIHNKIMDIRKKNTRRINVLKQFAPFIQRVWDMYGDKEYDD